MEKFKQTLEKPKITSSFVASTKDILKNARIYAKVAIPLLVFSLGKYTTAEGQNISMDSLSKTTKDWFAGKTTTGNMLEGVKNIFIVDDSYFKINAKENPSNHFTKNTSGENPFAGEIKIGADTINLGDITVETFGAQATENYQQNNKEDYADYSEFSTGVKKNKDGNNAEGGTIKTYTVNTYGDNPDEIILNALGEMSENIKSNIFSITESETKDGTKNKENSIAQSFKNITVSTSENNFKKVKAVIKETSKDCCSVTFTYVE
ncbi:MAG: hypothetical protein WCI93_02810 [bacterium]